MKLTVENGTSEETQELEEEVLLLGGDLVPAEALAAGLDIVVGDTLLDIGVEPVVRNVEVGVGVAALSRTTLLPELWWMLVL